MTTLIIKPTSAGLILGSDTGSVAHFYDRLPTRRTKWSPIFVRAAAQGWIGSVGAGTLSTLRALLATDERKPEYSGAPEVFIAEVRQRIEEIATERTMGFRDSKGIYCHVDGEFLIGLAVMTPDGPQASAWYMDGALAATELDDWYAIGSGGDYARGAAMALQACGPVFKPEPLEIAGFAMEAAARCDVATSPAHHIFLADGIWFPSERTANPQNKSLDPLVTFR